MGTETIRLKADVSIFRVPGNANAHAERMHTDFDYQSCRMNATRSCFSC